MSQMTLHGIILIYLSISHYFLYSNTTESPASKDNSNSSVNIRSPNKMRRRFQDIRTSCAMIANDLDYPYKFQIYIYPSIGFPEPEYDEHFKTGLYKASYSVGTQHDIPCLLEICGYGWNNTINSSLVNCDQFETTSLTLLPYTSGYIATSLTCGCNDREINNCTQDTCQLQEANYTWKNSDCAVMYEESNCQSCYFIPTVLSKDFPFDGRNTHEIKSIIVKSGCTVERATHGYMEQNYDYPNVTAFTGIVTDINPSFHVRSANFSCQCSPEDESTTKQDVESTTRNDFESTTKMEYESTTAVEEDESKDKTWMIYIGVGICVVLIGSVFVVLVIRGLRQRNSTKRRGNKIFQNNKIIQQDENTPYTVPCQTSDDSSSIARNQNATTPSSTHELKNEILSEVEQRIQAFLNTVFGQISHYPLDQQISLCEPLRDHVRELSKISNKERILSRTEFSINFQNPLGSGHFSTVYKGLFSVDEVNEPVAVKKLKREGDRDNWLFKSFLHEVNSFEIIENGSAFIVKYFGACCDPDGLYLLTEYCEHGSLRSFMVENIRPKYDGTTMEIDNMKDLGDNYFSDEATVETLTVPDYFQLLTWCKHITSGMEYLHGKRIIHGDLAARNVLITGDLVAKICDFGLSRKCTNKEYYEASLNKGDFPFNSLAPECVTNDGPNVHKLPLSIDIWAFGCTLWEMFTLGNTLYFDVEAKGMLKFIAVRERLLNGIPHEKPPLANEMIYGQMLECWNKEPDNRPSFQVLRMHFEKCIELEI